MGAAGRVGAGRARVAAIIEHVGRFIGAFSGTVILALMALTCLDVLKRRVMGRGIEGAIEITEVILVACVFLGMMVAELTGAHVRTPILTERLRPRARIRAYVAGNCVAVLLLLVTIVESTRTAVHSFVSGEVRHGVALIPLWPARFIIPLGLLGFALAMILNIVRRTEERD